MKSQVLSLPEDFGRKRLAPLVDESLQLARMMGASVATARRRLREEGEDFE